MVMNMPPAQLEEENDESSFCGNEDGFGDESFVTGDFSGGENLFPLEPIQFQQYFSVEEDEDEEEYEQDEQDEVEEDDEEDEDQLEVSDQDESESEESLDHSPPLTELERLEVAVRRGSCLATSGYQTASTAATTLYRTELVREVLPVEAMAPVRPRQSPQRRLSRLASLRLNSTTKRLGRAQSDREAPSPRRPFAPARAKSIDHWTDENLDESFSDLAIRRR
jgi:hypothetical protein